MPKTHCRTMANVGRNANAATATVNLGPQSLWRTTSSSSSLSLSPEPAQQALWAGALERHRRRLPRKYNAALQLTDYKSFSQALEAHDTNFRSKKVTKCLQRLSNSMKHLILFTRPLANFGQGQANPGCFIWGAIEALTIVCSLSRRRRKHSLLTDCLSSALCGIFPP